MTTEGCCPYCNGTGSLPAKTVVRYEQRRDEYAARLVMIQRLWGELANLYSDASPRTKRERERLTLDGLCAAVRTAYHRFPDLKGEYRYGPDPHE